jgi:hypothetical protein
MTYRITSMAVAVSSQFSWVCTGLYRCDGICMHFIAPRPFHCCKPLYCKPLHCCIHISPCFPAPRSTAVLDHHTMHVHPLSCRRPCPRAVDYLPCTSALHPGKKKKTLADFSIVRRIHFIFERAVRKFKTDLGIWTAWLEFCRSSNSNRRLSRVVARALQIHPTGVCCVVGVLLLTSSPVTGMLAKSSRRRMHTPPVALAAFHWTCIAWRPCPLIQRDAPINYLRALQAGLVF